MVSHRIAPQRHGKKKSGKGVEEEEGLDKGRRRKLKKCTVHVENPFSDLGDCMSSLACEGLKSSK